MTEEQFARPRLVVLSGPSSGKVFHLSGDEITIGRDAGNTLPIPDPLLSRQHCALAHDGACWTARDLGSFNGTFVNGNRITEAVLDDGDRMRAGDSELLFRTVRPESPDVSAIRSDRDSPTVSYLRLEDAAYLRDDTGSTPGLPETSRVQHDLKALVRVGTRINSIRDRETLQRELVDAAFAIVPATHAALLWLDGGEVSVAYARSRSPDVPLRLSHTVVDQAVSRVEGVLSKDVESDSMFRDSASVADAQLKSILAVPLLLDTRVAAVIYLSTSDPRVQFDDLHLELVTAIAGIGAVALDNVARIEWLETETRRLKSDLDISHEMIGDSPPMQEVYKFIAKVAVSDATVLIRGETGTGKELVARALHANSRRAPWPFVAINCAALTETLLENELFGHERGAFTDARALTRGKLEAADRGTVFLDEVAELSPALQAKLLRVLQEREFERVGGTRPVKVDIRIISATNRDLQRAVEAGAFRQDLFFRLNVVTLRMPSLRDRRQDVPRLAAHFALKFGRSSARRIVGISPDAQRCLRAYDWPGNVRELENAIERAVVLGTSAEIVPDDLPEALLDTRSAAEPAAASRFHNAVAETKKRVILEAIDRTGGNLTDAARSLGLHPNYLHRLLRTLDLRAQLPPKAHSGGEER
jgi:Nif-specific regulatory protein